MTSLIDLLNVPMPIDMQTRALLAALLAALLGLYLLLRRMRRSRQQQQQGQGQGQSGQNQSRSNRARTDNSEAQQRRAESALQRKIAMLEQIAGQDPLLDKQICRMAGVGHSEVKRLSEKDRELLRELAKRLPEDVIESLNIAANQKAIEFDLEKQVIRHKVPYLTEEVESERIESFDQLTDLSASDYALPPDEFAMRLVEQDFVVQQNYESEELAMLLYILLDVSGSMDEGTRTNLKRYLLARGITANLLLKAIKGQAKYYFREFDSSPHTMRSAMTEAEAEQLLDNILSRSHSSGGTNIFAAFAQAIDDIRTKGGDFAKAEILLISDGSDSSMDDVVQIQTMLGDDIRLHVIMIGGENQALRKVATSYQVFN